MAFVFEWKEKRLSTFAESHYCENYAPIGTHSSALERTDWRTKKGLVNRNFRTTQEEKTVTLRFSGYRFQGLLHAAQCCIHITEAWSMLASVVVLLLSI